MDWHSLQTIFGSLIRFEGTLRSFISHPTRDLVLMFFVIAAVFLYAISTGRGRIVLILLSTYISFGIANFLFLYRQIFSIAIPGGSVPRLYLFGGILIVTTLILFKTEVGSHIRSGMRDLSWLSALVLSILQSGLLTTFMYIFLGRAEKNLLSPLTVLLVGSPEAGLLWIIGPFLWLLVINFLTRD